MEAAVRESVQQNHLHVNGNERKNRNSHGGSFSAWGLEPETDLWSSGGMLALL